MLVVEWMGSGRLGERTGGGCEDDESRPVVFDELSHSWLSLDL
jgi:hypothetical protein